MARPNLLLFMPDQLRADAVGCFGNEAAHTPNIDAVAARGTRFASAYSQNPVCSPSRVSMLTGWYPHTRGHRTLTHLLKPWEPNLLRSLRDGGHNVAWVGHRGDTFAPGVTEESTDFSGFLTRPTQMFSPARTGAGDKWFDAYYYGRRETHGVVVDVDEATIRTAEAWLADSPREPWVLFVALVFPHCPFEVEEPWFSLVDRDAVRPPVPPADGKPMFHRGLRDLHGWERLDERDWREIRGVYQGMVARVDDQLGRVQRAVARAGASARTATVVFTDHGEYAGDFGLVEKWPSGMEDCLLRNPLVIDAPGGRNGQVSDALVEMIDLGATLLELAEVEPAHTHFGRSLVGLLGDGAASHRDAAFSEGGFLLADEPRSERPEGYYERKGRLQHEVPESAGKVTCIRTERWTYVHRLYEADELYDRVADPAETTNVADAPGNDEVVRTLRDRMLDWLVETSDVVPWEPDPRTPKIPQGYRP